MPAGGQKITVNPDFSLNVPDQPIIPYIEGDGTGVDITPVMIKVVDAAVAKAYGGKRKIHWMEIYAGEKSTQVYGPDVWLPDETLAMPARVRRLDQGPADHAGRRRHPLAQRRAAPGARPVRLPAPGPVLQGRAVAGKEPEKTDMVIFRENSEDIYAGIEFEAESDEGEEADRLPASTRWASRRSASRRPRASASSRCRAKAPSGWCARRSSTRSTTTSRSVTLVHKGNIMKFTEALPRLGLRARAEGVRREADRRRPVVQVQEPEDRPDIVVKDVIADAFLQQILLRPAEYDVIATLNLNGDYISDALAAQVGGIGIAPGANMSRLGRDVRGDARHRAEVRRQGLRQSRARRSFGRDDAAPHGLDRGGRPDHQLDGEGDPSKKVVPTTSRG